MEELRASVATLTADLEAATEATASANTAGDVEALNTTIAERDSAIAELEAQLADAETAGNATADQIAELTATIAERDAAIAALEAANAEVAANAAQETDAAEELAGLTATLAERDAAIAALEAALADAEAAVTPDDDIDVAELDAQMAALTEEMEAQARTIQNLRLGLGNPDQPAAELAQVCDTRAAEILEASQITFDTGTTSINAASAETLSQLRDIAIGCALPDLIIEIGGHTDSQGAEASNQAISEARAQAVLSFMVDGGVAPDAMRAVGFGETQPIASNDTRDGRAANRRITFEWQVRAAQPEIVEEAETTEADDVETDDADEADDGTTDTVNE